MASVLIAALSGRALAQSARKAGYAPLVVDAFGDQDTRNAADHLIQLKSAIHAGFRKKSLTAALDELFANATSKPIGLILGAGFEDQPALVATLANKFKILGNDAKTITTVKDPARLFASLHERGIRYPDTQFDPPTNMSGWLKKRIGGTGGVHITQCELGKNASQTPNYYYQRQHNGIPVSIAGAVNRSGFAIGLCRQWPSPTPVHPYRFGGLVTPPVIDPDTEARMIDMTVELTRAFDLKGFISIDFLITSSDTGEDILLLEINPRPTAALSILDGDDGHMFKAHVAATQQTDPTKVVTNSANHTQRARAVAYLYADTSDIEIPDIDWPAWAHDRPLPGTRIKRYRPLASVSSESKNADVAEQLCRDRLGELKRLLYGQTQSAGTTGQRTKDFNV